MENSPGANAIEVLSLTRRFNSLVAVDHLTFSCAAGATFGLLGPNGAGKSTLIKMLTTLLPPSEGTAKIAGCDLVEHPEAVRRKIGYVSQMLSADGDLTGYENLLISAKLYGMPRSERARRITQALEFMDLAHVRDKLVRQYSGGMIRRLEIAQSMLHRPKVLFLDEPSVGLDPSAKRAVWERIAELRREFGTTILMTTHDMEEADRLCDTIAVMHRGVLAAMDTPAALKAQVGPAATLDDVFIYFTGATIAEGGELEMPHAHESQFSEWAEPFPGANYLRQTLAVAEADVRKLIHDPVELLTRMVQPVLWLLVFGQVFNRTRAIPTGGISYLDFMSPGILAQSVLFGAIFYGISLIWERDLGIVQKFLVSPAPRSTLVLGRAISSTARSLCQMVFVYAIAFLLHVQLRFGVFELAGVVAAVMLGSAVFSTFSLIVACLVKSRERFMGIGQVLTMPLFFASNAIYPLSLMPSWLRVVARVNPLTYQVDVLRSLMVVGGGNSFGLGMDYFMQIAALVILVAVATKLYPSIVT